MDKALRGIGASVKAVGLKADDAPHGWVEGIANAFEVDRYNDLILPTALKAAFPKFMLNPVLSFGHAIDGNPQDGTLPAGTVLAMDQDEAGNTTFRARFAGTPEAQKVRQLYLDGDQRAFSIAFLPYGDSLESRQPTAEEVQRFPGVQRVITKLELIEIALCVVPVNAGSLASTTKSMNGGRLQGPPKLKQGARAMGKTILTSESKKAITRAGKAYEAHAKKLEAVAGHLDELAEVGDGVEGDHGAVSAKCMKAMEAATESHKALQDAVKAMHKSVTNDDSEDDEEDGAQPGTGTTQDGGTPAVNDTDAEKALKRFERHFAKK